MEVIKSVEPVLIQFTYKDDQIKSDHSMQEIRELVMSGKIIILKNFFPSNQMTDIKNKIVLWGKENPVFPHGESPSKYPDLNYHRIDDGSVPSVCPHLFHQYAFNSINKLREEYSKPFSDIADKLRLTQNLIADTSFDISSTGLRLKVLQYPEGGGFLQTHSHPLEPQKIGLILSLSEKDIDFKKGAVVFQTHEGFVDTEDYHNIGDVVVFRYDIPHGVTHVNREKESINWQLETGKWSVVLELRETHGLSHKKES